MSSTEILTLVLKGLVGGAVVVLFSVIGEVLRPRSVAGVTSGAPSVAIGSLSITVATTGAAAAASQSLGMIAGASALVVWCLCGLDTIKRFGAAKGSILAVLAWLASATALWTVALR